MWRWLSSGLRPALAPSEDRNSAALRSVSWRSAPGHRAGRRIASVSDCSTLTSRRGERRAGRSCGIARMAPDTGEGVLASEPLGPCALADLAQVRVAPSS
jgi:hypothetical protein